MKNILLILILIVSSSATPTAPTPWRPTVVTKVGIVTIAKRELEDVQISHFKRAKVDAFNIEAFKHKLAGFESGHSPNEYKLVNKFGYMGKYQFGKSTLKGLVKRGYIGKEALNRKKFLASPELQEQAMDALIRLNYEKFIKWGLTDYIGSKINGYVITREGMLAGAHLGGPGAVKKYLKTGGRHNPRDKFNTSIEKYMKAFDGK